jgi:hypothetical protein
MSSAIRDHPTYWLLGWLEANKIKTVAQAAALLAKPPRVRELRKVAEQWWESVGTYAPVGSNLVAGTGLRLDDDLTCPSPTCRRQQIDVLFRHAWHYFDRVLLPDGVGELLLHPPRGWDQEDVLEVLLHRIDLVLHIQKLGAIDLVYYYPPTWQAAKSPAEILDYEQEARWAEAWRGVEETLLSEGIYQFERLGPRRFRVDFADPLLDVASGFKFKLDKGESASEESLRAKVAHSIMHRHILSLEEDLQARHMLGATLGATVWSHERVLPRIGSIPGTAEIVFRLLIPSLTDIPIRDLIAVRSSEGASFETFRNALTKATREMVTNRSVSKPEDIAIEIIREIVEPELARLKQRLRAAQRALARKSAVSIALAGVTTTFGILLGIGPLVAGAAGVGAFVSGVGSATSKYIDEKQSVELSDMYFLWKALGHAT